MRRKLALIAAGVAVAIGGGLATAGSAQAATYYSTKAECDAARVKLADGGQRKCQQSWGGASGGWFINDIAAQG
ncbi:MULTISPECIES: hypothetical protein [Streptomyces]|uniref:Uncharacterized protein n=1 Tax=Streptomyces phaeolivaceus TaxID=2653200 RepID=A0A5P8KEY2_9ACTN|nr:hypothetical protein [Streptomyces phaeolivaceus]QFR01575.1 hypothetical protein F9278_41425 [Streptomyces phaeolivaceus]